MTVRLLHMISGNIFCMMSVYQIVKICIRYFGIISKRGKRSKLHGYKVPMSNTCQISPIQGLQHDIFFFYRILCSYKDLSIGSPITPPTPLPLEPGLKGDSNMTLLCHSMITSRVLHHFFLCYFILFFDR